jgi:small subunit ribosomal protein S20
MANTKSAKKQARQNTKRRAINLSRRSALKTVIKKVVAAVEAKSPASEVDVLLRQAQAQISRASGKGLLHSNNASRKISRLVAFVNKAA